TTAKYWRVPAGRRASSIVRPVSGEERWLQCAQLDKAAAEARHFLDRVSCTEDVPMMRSWIHFTRGRFVRQARVGLGELREEHLSRQGFAGPVAMLYRTDGPNEVVRIEGEYRPRQIDSADVVAADAADPRGAPLILLSNEDVSI